MNNKTTVQSKNVKTEITDGINVKLSKSKVCKQREMKQMN